MIIEKTHATVILSILFEKKAFEKGIIDLTGLKLLIMRKSSQIQNTLGDLESAGLVKTKKINGFPSHKYIWLTEEGKLIAPIADEYLKIYEEISSRQQSQ